jgi:hypothetical protein
MAETATSLANIAAMLIMACPAWQATARQLSARTMMAGAGNLPESRHYSYDKSSRQHDWLWYVHRWITALWCYGLL